MRKLALALALSICPLAVAPALAENAPVELATDLAPTLDPDSPQEVMKSVTKVATDWSNLGALAGAASLILLLTQLSKNKFATKLLDARGLGWTRPLIALALGAAGAAVAALQTGAPLGAALAAGLMAGLTGVGGHEVFRMASKKERRKVRVDHAAVAKATSALKDHAAATAKADDAAAAIKGDLARIAKLPEHKKLEELAALLSRQA